MKLRPIVLVLALLCVGAQAQVVEGPGWTASGANGPISAAEDSLVWLFNNPPASWWAIQWSPYNGNTYDLEIIVSFRAESGYKITGYDLSFDLDFYPTEYVVKGDEVGLYNKQPGEVIFGTGSFSVGGQQASFPGGTTPVSYHIDGEDFPLVPFRMEVGGYAFCSPKGMTNDCLFPGQAPETWIGGGMTFWSTTITPLVEPEGFQSRSAVAAIPEPETWILFTLSLVALFVRGRRVKQ